MAVQERPEPEFWMWKHTDFENIRINLQSTQVGPFSKCHNFQFPLLYSLKYQERLTTDSENYFKFSFLKPLIKSLD